MNRTKARELAVHFSYEMGMNTESADELLAKRFDEEYYKTLGCENEIYKQMPDEEQLEYITRLVKGVEEHGAELDSYIEKYAVGWKFSRISMMASAIMRVAMYEVLYMQDIPDGAAINEAVEIAKKYEPAETVAFINGILGSFIREEKQD